MQYVWQHRLLLSSDLHTVDGRVVHVIDPGRLNTDAGPDFFNAKVKIGDRLWAGDVEIHVRASDWHRHGHDGNPAYDSVVLHVVDYDDIFINRSNGEQIPQMVMRCAPEFHRSYAALVNRADAELPCAPHLAEFQRIYVTDWLSALAYERMYVKSDRFLDTLTRLRGDWEEALYITLARALGFGTNAEPMERLAQSVPLQFLRKHADAASAIEALLFGQAGMLDGAPISDPYVAQLKREHAFFAHKFCLSPLQPLGWKMGRMRPQNLPYRRVALLASLISSDFRLVRRIIELEDVEDAIKLFSARLTGYWARHYTFGAETQRPIDTLSRSSAILLVINVAVPLLMAYGTTHGESRFTERAAEWLTKLPAESNSIITLFAAAGLRAPDALTSQALIQLRREYCEKRRCIFCRFGHRLLAAKARR